MKYILFPGSYHLPPVVIKKVDDAAGRLGTKLSGLSVVKLNISEYNKRYLQDYIDNYSFYISIYTQLLLKAIMELKQAVEHSTLVDYGGGCGILSFLAKEAGFKSVIYNDIYQVSIKDIHVISSALDIPIDHHIHGDADVVVNYLNSRSLHPELICSMDVLEHIYSIGSWFNSLTKLNCDFNLVFMTSANARNPVISRRLRKMQLRDEYIGNQKVWGWKERDVTKAFLQARKEIIQDFAPGMDEETVELLAKGTRGLMKDDIVKIVQEYHEKGEIHYSPEHPANTCDPYTGNWSENILKPAYLKEIVESNGLEFEIRNSYYSYSDKGLINLIKRIINLIIYYIPSYNLFFSPAYVLIARRKSKTRE